MSNSKLSDVQNSFRKQIKAQLKATGGAVFAFPEYGATVAIRRTGATKGEFAVSLMSGDEQKFRRKVGEYHALIRWSEGNTLPCNLGDTETYVEPRDALLDQAYAIAQTIT